MYYILNGHEVARCPDLLTWGRWFETADRVVAWTKLIDGSAVSTVFLGLDHNYQSGGPPLLFETCMFFSEETAEPSVFMGRKIAASDITRRYATWAEAELGHMEIVEQLSVIAGGISVIKAASEGPGPRS